MCADKGGWKKGWSSHRLGWINVVVSVPQISTQHLQIGLCLDIKWSYLQGYGSSLLSEREMVASSIIAIQIFSGV